MESNGSSELGRLLKLRCSVQNYDWGRIGRESRVSRLFSLNSVADIEDDKPYAELWMGTHESGPSLVVPAVENGSSIDSVDGYVSLKSWIANHSSVLGDKVVEKWGTDLPFLFKVLSVAKALSIQAHPDKELAGFLHKTQPNIYKDSNHKPEMALALTEFEALCGFISLQELKSVLQNVPEIVELVGSAYADQMLQVEEHDVEEKVKAALQSIFTQLMSAKKDAITESVSKLINRLNKDSEVRKLTDKEELVLRLEKQYPADVGVMAALLFNQVKLKPGEGLYIGANELHAYISGECIECMATSDNVVRAGLTPKYRDIQILCSMLTYKQGKPEIIKGVEMDEYTKRFVPPFEEFEVDQCILPHGVGASTVFAGVAGPSIFVVIAGEGTLYVSTSSSSSSSSSSSVEQQEYKVKEGDVLFAPARTQIRVLPTSSLSELQLYRAGINSSSSSNGCFKPASGNGHISGQVNGHISGQLV